MHQNHTRNRADSRAFGDKKANPCHARKGALVPDHVHLAILS